MSAQASDLGSRHVEGTVTQVAEPCDAGAQQKDHLLLVCALRVANACAIRGNLASPVTDLPSQGPREATPQQRRSPVDALLRHPRLAPHAVGGTGRSLWISW
jgi:hypothetical protein